MRPSSRWPRRALRAALATGALAAALGVAASVAAPAFLAAGRLGVCAARRHSSARPAAEGSPPASDAPSSFRAKTKIRLRERADVNSKPTGDVLEEGEIFICSGLKPPSDFDRQGYFRVLGKNGWAFHLGVAGPWAGQEIVDFLDEAMAADPAAGQPVRESDAPKYRASTRIFLRRFPDVKSPRSGEVLEVGEVFEAKQLQQPPASDGMVYLQVKGREGWAFNKGVAGAWLDKHIVETLDARGRIQGPLEANVTDADAEEEQLRSANLMEDEGVWLSAQSVDRIEGAARVGRSGELREEEERKPVEAEATKEELRALRAVRRVLTKLQFAQPDSLDSLCEEVEAVFQEKSPALGSQRLIAREEMDSMLQVAQKRVKSAA